MFSIMRTGGKEVVVTGRERAYDQEQTDRNVALLVASDNKTYRLLPT